MNESVLYNYFAEELNTHIRIFSKEAAHLTSYIINPDIHDDFADSLDMICPQYPSIKEPHLFTVNSLLSYMLVPVRDTYCLVGPVGVCSDCIARHHLPSLILPNELISQLASHESNRLVRIGTSLYNLFSEIPISTSYCYSQNCIGENELNAPIEKATRSLFAHEEYGDRHNPYEAEKREMASIESGNLQLLRESWKDDHSEYLGQLSTDIIRNAKYLCIVNIALSARAAVRGGLSYEMAYSLADAYCQQIDAFTQAETSRMETVIRNIQVTFTKLVAQQKGDSAEHLSESPLVERAKNYIFSRLHGKLTVSEVADSLAVHPNYLNLLFKKYQGITVHDYILREKTNWARNLLTYSEYSYSEIATYLGFSSQSHLGGTFKKFTGMTLKQYRDSYQKKQNLDTV